MVKKRIAKKLAAKLQWQAESREMLAAVERMVQVSLREVEQARIQRAGITKPSP